MFAAPVCGREARRLASSTCSYDRCVAGADVPGFVPDRAVMISATQQRHLRAVAAFELAPGVAGGFTALVGVLVMIGWWQDIEALRTIVPGLIPMIPNTALACIIGGLSLALAREDGSQKLRDASRFLAYGLVVLGAV